VSLTRFILAVPIMPTLLVAAFGCNGAAPLAPIETIVFPEGSVLAIRGVRGATLSADGRHLAYCGPSTTPSEFHVYISDADGANARHITTAPATEADPSWSADGRKIIFARAARHRPYSMGGWVWDQWDVWTVNADGGGEHQLTHESFYQAGSPHFSPDQRRVLFWAYRQPPPDAPLGQPGSADLGIGELDDSGTANALRWMPRTAGPGGINVFSADNRDPSFSPDGTAIAFISNRVGRASPYDYEVWLTDPAFDRVVQLTHLHARLARPTFTSDGGHILFTAADVSADGKARLWRMKPDGSELIQLR
jgi:Tol biopolymer transport system component